jgi:hypothetical protein
MSFGVLLLRLNSSFNLALLNVQLSVKDVLCETVTVCHTLSYYSRQPFNVIPLAAVWTQYLSILLAMDAGWTFVLRHASFVDCGSAESCLACLIRKEVPVKMVLPVAGWFEGVGRCGGGGGGDWSAECPKLFWCPIVTFLAVRSVTDHIYMCSYLVIIYINMFILFETVLKIRCDILCKWQYLTSNTHTQNVKWKYFLLWAW